MGRFLLTRRALAVGGAALPCLLLVAGCQRPREDAGADPGIAPPEVAATPEPAAATPPPGRHALTAVPPMEVFDLDRMSAQGFTPEEMLAAIRQRGVLRVPDPLESARLTRLPGGARLVEAMAAPANVLQPGAVEAYQRRLAAGYDAEQAQNALLSRGVAAPPAGYQPANSSRTLRSENLLHRQELSQRIAMLRKRYNEQLRRGESGAILGMEIERLQRELDALPPLS